MPDFEKMTDAELAAAYAAARWGATRDADAEAHALQECFKRSDARGRDLMPTLMWGDVAKRARRIADRRARARRFEGARA